MASLRDVLAMFLTIVTQANNAENSVVTVLWLLIAVAVVAVLTKYIRLPYTIALVLAGIVIAFTPGMPKVVLTPDLIVTIFLPTLLFEAAYNLSFEHLREEFRFISALAIWGVVATVGLVAGLLIWWGGLAWQTALIFGAIVGATDPISVVATFRSLGVARRLTIIIEGESLFNDGSALVIFNLLLGVIVAGNFDLVSSLAEFIKVSVGGLGLGVAVGYLALAILEQLNDYLTETLVTLIAAYATFLGAEQFGVSPALAVVAAGLLVGNFGQQRAMSPTTRITVGLSWEFFGFMANSLIFLLVGLQVRTINLGSFGTITGLAIIVTLLSRCVVIFFFSWLTRLINRPKAIPFSWQLMLIWGGLRGSLSLAMALSLPVTLASGELFPDRDKILVMTFGLIMFSLLGQGLTTTPLMNLLKLGRNQSKQIHQYETLHGRLLTLRAAQQEIQEMQNNGTLGAETAQILQADYASRENAINLELQELHLANEFLREEQLRTAQRRLLQVERSTLLTLRTRGVISHEILEELRAEIDTKATLLTQAQAVDEPSQATPEFEVATNMVEEDDIITQPKGE
jgi:CPA1 family monovalent cation:H+ antiporter